VIIIGIDPGSRICGYGLLETQKRSIIAAGCDAIDARSVIDLQGRLAHMFTAIEAVVEEYKPDAAAVESLFYHKNIRSVLTLGQARGVILLALARQNIPMVEYSPREVKKAVVGNGGATKQQVRYMIDQMFKLTASSKPDDAYDALAIAVCHFNRIKFTL
jgi:crossover junction endodeoxyribonuclease RuvC